MPTFHYKANLMINDYFIIRERKYFGNWQISHILRRAEPFMVKIIEKTQRNVNSQTGDHHHIDGIGQKLKKINVTLSKILI